MREVAERLRGRGGDPYFDCGMHAAVVVCENEEGAADHMADVRGRGNGVGEFGQKSDGERFSCGSDSENAFVQGEEIWIWQYLRQ